MENHPPQLSVSWLAGIIAQTLDEDLGGEPGRDVTTQATVTRETQVSGAVQIREPGVVAGVAVIAETLAQVAERLTLATPEVTLHVHDGQRLDAGGRIADITGSGQVVLVAERTILNLLGRATAVATHTRRWADALAGTGATVLDTRKTTPGLRALEKYAVRLGGGGNKRFGLFDVAMVKDNHILAAGSVTAAIDAISQRYPDVSIEVEVESHDQVVEALEAGARSLMLDNMDTDLMRAVVADVRGRETDIGRVELEATGGLTIGRAAEVAATGVDYLSVGALTHSSPLVDIGLDLY